jgi:hypothetical protein
VIKLGSWEGLTTGQALLLISRPGRQLSSLGFPPVQLSYAGDSAHRLLESLLRQPDTKVLKRRRDGLVLVQQRLFTSDEPMPSVPDCRGDMHRIMDVIIPCLFPLNPWELDREHLLQTMFILGVTKYRGAQPRVTEHYRAKRLWIV